MWSCGVRACRFCEVDSVEKGGPPAATALLVAAFRLFVFAACLRADFSFRFRTAFFAADILTVRMSILSGRSYAPFTAIRLGYFWVLSMTKSVRG